MAAAMADVSPVPSEGARALAVDSRAAAPQNDATAGRTRARARPRNASARKPPAAPGSPRSTGAQTQRSRNWPDDPAARRGGRANQGSAVRAVSPISVGATAHVIAGNCGVVRRSKPLNPRADCVLGHGVAMALRHGFLPRLRLCPLAPTALRLSEQVQGNLDAVRAVYGGTGNARLCRPWLFCAIFYCRNSEASERLARGRIRHKPPRNHPQNAPSQAPRHRK